VNVIYITKLPDSKIAAVKSLRAARKILGDEKGADVSKCMDDYATWQREGRVPWVGLSTSDWPAQVTESLEALSGAGIEWEVVEDDDGEFDIEEVPQDDEESDYEPDAPSRVLAVLMALTNGSPGGALQAANTLGKATGGDPLYEAVGDIILDTFEVISADDLRRRFEEGGHHG
jgi:hypothetical protein